MRTPPRSRHAVRPISNGRASVHPSRGAKRRLSRELPLLRFRDDTSSEEDDPSLPELRSKPPLSSGSRTGSPSRTTRRSDDPYQRHRLSQPRCFHHHDLARPSRPRHPTFPGTAQHDPRKGRFRAGWGDESPWCCWCLRSPCWARVVGKSRPMGISISSGMVKLE